MKILLERSKRLEFVFLELRKDVIWLLIFATFRTYKALQTIAESLVETLKDHGDRHVSRVFEGVLHEEGSAERAEGDRETAQWIGIDPETD